MGTMAGAVIVLLVPASASAALDPSPASYDWGQIDRYQQSPQQNFTFTNNEGAQVTVGTPAFSGANASEFSIANQNCAGAVLNDTDSCTVTVYVQPQSVGPKSASLDVDDGNGTASVALSATAMTGTLGVSPNPIGFSPQPWYFGSAFQQVNVQNSNFTTAIASVSLSGTDAGMFSIAFDGCSGFTPGPGNGCSVGLNFNPSGPSGPASANLVIVSDSAASPTTTPITADALAGPHPVVTPDGYDFGPTALGAVSGPQTFTLTNTGDFPAQIQQLLIVTGSPQSFPLSANACALAVVMPAASCTFSIGFAPQSVGVKEASIFVIANTPAPVTQVALSGEGFRAPGISAAISGTPAAGETLTCEPSNASGELSFAWLRDGAPIGGATGPTYAAAEGDIGKHLSCRITATNPLGSVSAESAATPPVAPRDLAGDQRSFVDEGSCRVVAAEPIAGVTVGGSAPATPESPLRFSARRSITVELGGRTRSGQTVRFTPRQLSELADGPQPLTVDGRPSQLLLAPCQLSARVSGSRQSRTTYALSGATGIASGSISTPKLRIGGGAGVLGQATVFAHGEPETHFALAHRRTSYNGIHVRLTDHRVAIEGLPANTAVVQVEFEAGLVRGRGGNARAGATLATGAEAQATVAAYWR